MKKLLKRAVIFAAPIIFRQVKKRWKNKRNQKAMKTAR
ncbi:UNVERIFIED_ORG: hypothetical protein ABIC97_000158 [Peribacillus simplex]|jgi:hypothetical protein